MSKAKADPHGWKDYTYPMTIIGQELNVAIDIAAQSLPTLDINIAASAVSLDVNIASSAVTLNINIESISEGVVFNVAQSGTWTINAVQTGTWTINIGGPLDASGYVQTHIMDSVQLDVNIAASAVTLNVAIQSSAVTLNVNIESISEGVVFNVAQSGTWTINAVQSGDWNINIESVSEGVTLNVNIASSSVAINIKTETGANIVIDKLVESAYTEERRVIANNGPSAIMQAPGIGTPRGKYFPRGCRGFIHEIEVYCDNPSGSAYHLYIYVSPQPGMAPIIVKTLYVAANASPAWRPVTINYYWSYDSLFVWVLSETNDYPRVGYDTGEPYDALYSTDGETWVPENYRWWIRLDMAGQTVGDLPVSGTLSTIEIPHSSSQVESGNVSLPGLAEDVELVSVEGAGYCDLIIFQVQANTDSHYVGIKVECDGQTAFSTYMHVLYLMGCGSTTRPLLLTQYSENGYIALIITQKFQFLRKFRVLALNASSTSQTVAAYIITSLIK